MPPFLPQARIALNNPNLGLPGIRGLGDAVAQVGVNRTRSKDLASLAELAKNGASTEDIASQMAQSGDPTLATLGLRTLERTRARTEDRAFSQAGRDQSQANADRASSIQQRRLGIAEQAQTDSRAAQTAFNAALSPGQPPPQDNEFFSPVEGTQPTQRTGFGSAVAPVPINQANNPSAGGGLLGGLTPDEQGQVRALGLSDPKAAIVLATKLRENSPGVIRRNAEIRENVKVDAKIRAQAPQALARANSALSKASDIGRKVSALIKHGGLDAATGPVASRVTTFSPKTSNFETSLKTVKGKLFISAIAEMRELSKTGGALGSVTENEIKLMENSVENLDLAQGPQSMRFHLQQVAIQMNESMGRIAAAYKAQFGRDLKFTPIPIGPLQASGEGAALVPKDITEDDIQTTMRENNMTRQQVLNRLGAR